MANENAPQSEEIQDFDFESMETEITKQIEDQLADLEISEKDREMIGNPDSLGKTVLDTAWEQLMNQIAITTGVDAGKDFISENNGMTLDLSKDAHIQSAENFGEGKFATHNADVGSYKEKYKNMQNNFEKDNQGNIKYHPDRSGNSKENLVKGARAAYDKDRPNGSKIDKTDMDHIVAAAELIRDPATNLYMSEAERIAFANSPQNLNEINLSWNRSKSDLSMEDWLNKPNANGQTPKEIFDITDAQEKALVNKDKIARKALSDAEQPGKDEIEKSGKESQLSEAGKFAKSVVLGAAKAVALQLLAKLTKDIIQGFISWLRGTQKSFNTFMEAMKSAINEFVVNFRKNLTDSAVGVAVAVPMSIITSVVGDEIMPLVMLVVARVKQEIKLLREVVAYIRKPENRKKSVSMIVLEVGKIVTAGVTVIGAIDLSFTISASLKSAAAVPSLQFLEWNIPVLGKLSSLIGILLGSLITGIIGAIMMNFINKIIAKKLKAEATKQILEHQNQVKQVQAVQGAVLDAHLEQIKDKAGKGFTERREFVNPEAKRIVENIKKIPKNQENKQLISENKNDLDEISKALEELKGNERLISENKNAPDEVSNALEGLI